MRRSVAYSPAVPVRRRKSVITSSSASVFLELHPGTHPVVQQGQASWSACWCWSPRCDRPTPLPTRSSGRCSSPSTRAPAPADRPVDSSRIVHIAAAGGEPIACRREVAWSVGEGDDIVRRHSGRADRLGAEAGTGRLLGGGSPAIPSPGPSAAHGDPDGERSTQPRRGPVRKGHELGSRTLDGRPANP